MTDVPEDVRGLAAATLDNDAVRLVLADALQEAGEERMAERCRTVGLARFELERLADGTAVTPERLRHLHREHCRQRNEFPEEFDDLLPNNWYAGQLDTYDLAPDAACSWAHSGLPDDRLDRESTEAFGTDFAQQIFLFADGSLHHYPSAEWEKGPECHDLYGVFAFDLTDRLRRSTLYTLWCEHPDYEDDPGNVPEAYRGFLSWFWGDTDEAARSIRKEIVVVAGDEEEWEVDEVEYGEDEWDEPANHEDDVYTNEFDQHGDRA